MKNLFNNTANKTKTTNGFSSFISGNVTSVYSSNNSYNDGLRTNFSRENLLVPAANLQMKNGMVPELWNVCLELFNTFFVNQAPYSAIQFIPVLQQLNGINNDQLKRFLKNPETRQVLVQNELVKIVLIHWKPGKVSDVHGHPKGGCAFKVLHGKIEELRYTTDSSQRIISSCGYRAGSIAYIDDNIGYHAVGNPFGTSAVSLHVYTPGK